MEAGTVGGIRVGMTREEGASGAFSSNRRAQQRAGRRDCAKRTRCRCRWSGAGGGAHRRRPMLNGGADLGTLDGPCAGPT